MDVLILLPSGTLMGGNRTTANRYAQLLEALGHTVTIHDQLADERPGVLIAIHALKSHEALSKFHTLHPGIPTVLVLAGTDIYPEPSKLALQSIRIADRTKDLIKSGGEWISSVDLENAIMSHPKVAEAAVVGIPHPKWDERPLACVVVKPGEQLTEEEVLEHLKPLVAKWWMPEAVEFIDEVPKTSVGKFSKKDLRAKFAEYELKS